jgi:ketosteroid isomerase-like protein
MSQQNEAAIRAIYGAWGDQDLETFLRFVHPGVEFRPSGAFPDLLPVYQGHAGAQAFWEAMRAPWQWLRIDVERIVEGRDRAAVALHLRALGKASGVVTDLRQAHAMRFKDARVVEVSAHRSFDHALGAAGLQK